mmetsp:Transcript_108226/g.305985  ORF Transcript_108226/g.305985 Transcript_108226/m.305985 type:complete len:347 (+) Transcript_108226:1-1041(+)
MVRDTSGPELLLQSQVCPVCEGLRVLVDEPCPLCVAPEQPSARGRCRLPVEVNINTLSGVTSKVFAEPFWTVSELKGAIEAQLKVEQLEQRLIHGTLEIHDAAFVSEIMRDSSATAMYITMIRRPRKEVELERNKWIAKLTDPATAASIFRDAPRHIRADRRVVLKAVQVSGDTLEFATKKLQGDREVVITAVTSNWDGNALEYAAEDIRADRDVVVAAVLRTGDALEFAAESLRADREVVLTAVSANGIALRFASVALQGDRDVVLAAVRRDAAALSYASKSFQEDREAVLEAIRVNGAALKFASEEFQADPELFLAAAETSGTLITSDVLMEAERLCCASTGVS